MKRVALCVVLALLATSGIAGELEEVFELPVSAKDGHASFTRYPSAWRPPFEEFLRRQGF